MLTSLTQLPLLLSQLLCQCLYLFLLGDLLLLKLLMYLLDLRIEPCFQGIQLLHAL